MRVVQLTAWHVRIPLRKPIQHASHTRSETDNLIVRCTLADGTTGFGEGVPRDYVTGETIDSALDLLRRSQVGQGLPKDDCPDFASAVRLAENLRLAEVPGDDRACGGNAARCAVELALLDAFGRYYREPLRSVTALLAAPDLFEPRDWSPLQWGDHGRPGAQAAIQRLEILGLRLSSDEDQGRHRRSG